MESGHEVGSPATGDSTPLPRNVMEAGAAAPMEPPNSAAVLGWIAARAPEPWFPSAHSREHAVSRDTLDEPLSELRLTELIQISAWVKGTGQGYTLTPAGEAAVKDPRLAERFHRREPVAATADQPTDEIELSPAVLQSTPIEFRPPVVTPAIVAANLLWFAVAVVYALWKHVPIGPFLAKGDFVILHRFGAIFGTDLLLGQWWRLLTSCFVHFGAFHLIMNMVALGSMGPLAELLWGRWRLLVIYFFAGLGGSCLAMAIYPIDPNTGALPLLAGASGAICGVLIALLTWMMLYRDYLPTPVAADLLRRLGWAVILTAGVSLIDGVSWQGHLGGAVTGFITGVLLNAQRFGERRQKWAATIGLITLPLVCVAGLVAAIEYSGTWGSLRALIATPAKQSTPTDTDAKIEAARKSWTDFEKNIAGRLNELSPEAVAKLDAEAELILVRSIRKKPESTKDVRAKVEKLRTIAAEVIAKLSMPPTGISEIDSYHAKAIRFATARAKSLDLLLDLLDNPAADPDGWHTARDEANRLWGELTAK